MALPQAYIDKMKNLLGEDFNIFMDSYDADRNYGLRINPLKISSKEFQNKCVFELKPVPWCPEGFYYNGDIRPAKHPYYHAGLYYLQEPSAMSPGAVLPVQKGDRVLDLCAAPGGKTTHIAGKLGNTGLIIANDISPTRAKAIVKNIELAGVRNCIVTAESPEKLGQVFGGYFDKILVDAPCSGEGMFRKEPELVKAWNEELIAACQNTQREILVQAADMLKAGGMMLYSTCTFNPDENEQIISDFLKMHKDFRLVPIEGDFGFEDGKPEWIRAGDGNLRLTKRLWPHCIEGEGHFLALLQKQGDLKGEQVDKAELAPEEAVLFTEFSRETLNPDLVFEGSYQIINDSIYLLPKGLPTLKGLRILRSGLLVGTIKKNRFEPSQALAMALRQEDVLNTADFELTDERGIRYLKGETVVYEDSGDGWCLVLVDGYPLGWAKSQKGRLKNKYPLSWMWN